MTYQNWLIRFFLLAIAGAAADIYTKDFISGKLPDEERVPAAILEKEVVPGYLSLLTNSPLNKGALFSLGDSYKEVANWVFISISGLAVLGIVIWALWPHSHRKWIYLLTVSLILAGAFGNCFDRVVYGGVRDWIWFYIRNAEGKYVFSWPVFNLADCYLVGGAILLVIHGLFFSPKPAPLSSGKV